MKRLWVLAMAALLCACTPDLDRLVAMLQQEQQQAEAAGEPCPELAGHLVWRGLPLHFLEVIWRESNCQPGAVNKSSGALGLTQIMPFWLAALCPAGIACTEADLLTWWANLDAAAYVYAVQGPSAWSQTW